MSKEIKLNLGAGTDIRDGYINHDIVQLDGIDVVHNLNKYPWPWEDNSIDEIIAIDLVEHLDEFLPAMEELHRVLKHSGRLNLKVPYWNSVFRHIDPTHKRGFHEVTFHFFDPSKEICQLRRYYTHARFSIDKEVFILIPFAPYLTIPGISPIHVSNKIAKRIVGFFGNLFSNIILDLDIGLRKLPADNLS
jgi:SAM-dependent methyltransferase